MDTIFNFAFLILGFGFVIFWHELGHFLAAKWAGVKVDQFAVGFGHALVSWRKGLGFRVGTSFPEYQKRAQARLDSIRAAEPVGATADKSTSIDPLDAAARSIGLGETEYRLNWLPLGGYVRMLGQDDMDPNATSSDSRSYNRKTVGQRMVIISAGVVMNILLAGILFWGLFLYGFNTPPAIVGQVSPNSPAQRAGIEPGDKVLEMNGTPIHDFNKLVFNTPLLPPGVDVSIVIDRAGERITKTIRPVPTVESRGMLSIGVGPAVVLAGPDKDDIDAATAREIAAADTLQVVDLSLWTGSVVTHVAGTPVLIDTLVNRAAAVRTLDQALQSSQGKPVELTLRLADGSTRLTSVRPRFAPLLGGGELNFAGLSPRVRVESVMPESPVKGKIKPGDVVTGVRDEQGNTSLNPSTQAFRQIVRSAGESGMKLSITVLRGDEVVTIADVEPFARIDRGIKGLLVGLTTEEMPVVGKAAAGSLDASPAALAGVPAGLLIQKLNDVEVANWSQVKAVLEQVPADSTVTISGTLEARQVSYLVKLGAKDIAQVASNRYSHGLPLKPMIEARKTSNPLTAVWWGVGETRDLILKTYVTLKRAFYDGSVPMSNFSGPVGIVHAGSIFAGRGTDWLIWFLALISANLAVVNFLPIPIVDGGHFCFLILEKITGKPPSPKLMAAAQIAGLVLILSFFVFVTFNDIANLIKL